MSWDLAWIQSQVQMATSDNGLASKAVNWCNRTLMEIGTAAFLPKQLAQLSQFPIASGSNTITNAWNSITGDDVVNIHRINIQSPTTATTFYNPLTRVGIRDLYAFFRGAAATSSADLLQNYAVPRWTTFNTSHLAPQVVPFPNENSARSMEIHYLKAPTALASGSDTNWILRRYPYVVLAGTLRRAFLYKGDGARYTREMAAFQNGLKDILRQETGDIAHAPTRRALGARYAERG